MNILFITRYPITDQKGGIERISDIIIRSLPSNYKVFSAYINESRHKKTPVKAFLNIGHDSDLLYEFVKHHNIDFIVNQQCYELDDKIATIKNELGIKTIFFQHDKTIDPYVPLMRSFGYALCAQIPLKNKFTFLSKLLLFPLYYKLKTLRDRRLFRNIYNNNDRLLILTPRYLPILLKTLGIISDDKHRIGIINNSLTLNNPIETPIQSRPQKVLIVSRMTEERKRILLALKIWRLLQSRYPGLNSWELELVGSGEYLSLYKSYTNKHKVQNVIFKGQVNDINPHYASSQIFMMTSYSEGWGLTVTEAQQYGVVPIAFNSYEAINDIITTDYNGILVTEGDIDGYVNQLASLMLSAEKRETLSYNAQISCKRYSVDNIVNQWITVFNDVSSIK